MGRSGTSLVMSFPKTGTLWINLSLTLPKESNSPNPQMSRKLARRGWLTLAWPREYGGMGGSHMEQLIYREETAYHDVPGTDLGTGAIGWVGPTLMLVGTEEQKREHIPLIAGAERHWCTLYSEPESGSDLASVQTRAVRDGDDYVIDGAKIWTSSAHIADRGLARGPYRSRCAQAPWYQPLPPGHEYAWRHRPAHSEHDWLPRIQSRHLRPRSHPRA